LVLREGMKMFKVYYQLTSTPMLLAMLETREEAEMYIAEDHEKDMITHAEDGGFDGMTEQEKQSHYEEDISRYSIFDARRKS